MSLDQQDLDEFKKIYKEVFCEDITDRQAADMGRDLLNLFIALAKDQSQARKIE